MNNSGKVVSISDLRFEREICELRVEIMNDEGSHPDPLLSLMAIAKRYDIGQEEAMARYVALTE